MITNLELVEERLRMEYECLKTGKYLNVGLGDSESFWNRERYLAGNRWWKFWKNKTDFEIIRENWIKMHGEKLLHDEL